MSDFLTYSIEEIKEILGCEEAAAIRRIDAGDLAAVKIGRSWIFPKAAFDQRLNELALEEAAERRLARSKPPPGAIFTQPPQAHGRRRARVPPPLPSLPPRKT
jgi:hypothetical protein